MIFKSKFLHGRKLKFFRIYIEQEKLSRSLNSSLNAFRATTRPVKIITTKGPNLIRLPVLEAQDCSYQFRHH